MPVKNQVYFVIINTIPCETSFRSLRAACKHIGFNYSTVTKDFKGSFERKGKGIYRTTLAKIKGRGKQQF